MLEATLELLGADMGYVRLLNGKGLLTIVAQRGFGEDIVDTFREIGIDDDVTCRKALHLRQRTVIEDIETDPFYSPLRGVARAAGYRALQCTPLIARNGRPLGMLSTHFRSVHRPLEEHFRRLDLYARQAVEFIERCRIDEALRESERQFRATFDLAASGMTLLDAQTGRFIQVNDRFCQITGRSRDELMQLTPSDLTYPDDRARDQAGFVQLLRGEIDEYHVEKRYVRPDGTVRWVVVSVRLLRDHEGHPLRTTAVIQDVTDRQRVQEALQASENRQRLFSQHAPAAIAMFDREMRYLTVSRRWLENYGLGNIDLGGRSHYEVFPEIPERWKEVHRRGLRGESLHQEADRFERADGSVQWIKWQMHPWYTGAGEVGGIVLFTEDVTARFLAEEALRRSEAKLAAEITITRRLQELSTRLICRGELQTLLLEILAASADLTGTDKGSIQVYNSNTGTLRLVVHQGLGGHLVEHLAGPGPVALGDMAMRHAQRVIVEDVANELSLQGTVALACLVEDGIRSMQCTPIVSRDGRVLGLLSNYFSFVHRPAEADLRSLDLLARMAADLIERDQVEEELARAKRRTETVLDSAGEAIFGLNADGLCTFINPAGAEMFGYRIEDLLGKNTHEILHHSYPDGRPFPAHECPIYAAFADGKKHHADDQVFWRKDGTPISVSYTSTPVLEDERLVGAVVVIRDITERKRTEAALVDQQRLLRESEERLRTAMAAGEMGAWDIDLAKGLITWNAKQYELFGRSLDQAPKTVEQFYELVHPEDVHRIQQAAQASERTGKFSEEFRIIRTDGQVRWIAGRGAIVYDGAARPVRMIGVNYDITERKDAQERLVRFTEELERRVTARTSDLLESEMRLRALASELNLAEQRERKRLATELHDYLQQMLVLGKLKLGQGKRLTESNIACAKMIGETDDILSDALTYTRTLVAELSPAVLRDHGLTAALRWLAEYMRKHDLTVTVTAPDNECATLPEDQVVLLFQSVRELLINSSKYSGTGHATVTLERPSGCLRIHVCDKGAGFDVDASMTVGSFPSGLSSKFGLFSIRERMKALGGFFDIQSAPGKGTRATLELPMPSPPWSQEKLNTEARP
jgi:PAS domain S-box-containing protein